MTKRVARKKRAVLTGKKKMEVFILPDKKGNRAARRLAAKLKEG